MDLTSKTISEHSIQNGSRCSLFNEENTVEQMVLDTLCGGAGRRVKFEW